MRSLKILDRSPAENAKLMSRTKAAPGTARRSVAGRRLLLPTEHKLWGAGGARASRAVCRAGHRSREAQCCLEAALQTFTTLTAQFEIGRTHLDLAVLAQSQGNLAVAITHLRTAHGVFETLRVPPYVERTAQLARALGIASEVLSTPAYCDVSPTLNDTVYSAGPPLDRILRNAYGREQ
jgi:hypothetical protein